MILRALTYILSVLVIIWGSLFFFCEIPFGQHLIQSWIRAAGRNAGLVVCCDHISLSFPFSIRLQDLHVFSEDEAELLSCERFSFTPLLFDMPFGRLTMLRVRGRGIEVNLDTIERRSSGKLHSIPTISLHGVRLISVHVKSSRIPNDEQAIDGSLKGSLYLASDLSNISCSLSCWRSTPSCWPKELNCSIQKSSRSWLISSSLSLSTEGVPTPIPQLFYADDRLETSFECTLKEPLQPFSVQSIENLSGTWRLTCPRAGISHSSSAAIQRFLRASGTVGYQPDHELNITCSSLEAVFVAGRLVKAIQDPETHSMYHEDLFSPYATLRVKGAGSISAFTLPDAVRFRISVPTLSLNENTGSASGIIDCQVKDGGLAVVGDLKANPETSPIQVQSKMFLTDLSMSASCDIVASLIRSSLRYQCDSLSQKLSAFVRFHDLSLLHPSLQGTADLSTHTEITSENASLSLSGHIADLRSSTIECRNADISVSGNPLNLTQVSANIDVSGLHYADVQLEQAHIATSYNLQEHSLPYIEASMRGQYSLLPFDIFTCGTGHSILTTSHLSLNRLEGSVAQYSIGLDHPITLNHEYARLTKLQADLTCGDKGRLHISIDSPSAKKGLLEASCDNLPLAVFANLLDIPDADGTLDGACHYQAQPGFIVGNANYNATIQRFSVFGGEGGAIAVGGTASLRNNLLSTSFCAAGTGIHEPLLCSLSCQTSRIKGSPFFQIPPSAVLQGSLKGEIILSKLLSRWRSGQAGFDGHIGCSLTIGGTYESPYCKGPIHVRNGRIDLLPTGEVIDEISMDGGLENGSIRVDTITATDGKEGSVSGSGTVEITPQLDVEWKTTLSCTNVDIVTLDYANVTADGNVQLVGTSSTLHISGTAQTKKAFIDLSARFPSDVPEIPVIYRGVTPDSTPFLVTLALQIDGSNGVAIRGRGVSSLWTGQIQVSGPQNAIVVYGQLTCQKGSFMLGSKELSITEGTMTCAGDLFRDSRCNVRADITLPSIAAQVFLRGSLEKPKFLIQSIPPRPDNEILSLLLFNKEFGDISSLESLQLAQTALSLDQSSGPFELIERIKQTLGIDVIDIGSTSPLPLSNQPPTALDPTDASTAQQLQKNDVSLKVGKYILDGVAVTVSKDVSSSANRIGIEAQLSKEVSACAAVGDDAEGILSFKWKHHY